MDVPCGCARWRKGEEDGGRGPDSWDHISWIAIVHAETYHSSAHPGGISAIVLPKQRLAVVAAFPASELLVITKLVFSTRKPIFEIASRFAPSTMSETAYGNALSGGLKLKGGAKLPKARLVWIADPCRARTTPRPQCP